MPSRSLSRVKSNGRSFEGLISQQGVGSVKIQENQNIWQTEHSLAIGSSYRMFCMDKFGNRSAVLGNKAPQNKQTKNAYNVAQFQKAFLLISIS